MKTAIINGSILTPFTEIEHGTILIEDGKIIDINTENSHHLADTIIDAQGCYVSPGFIDIHVHGGGGADFMDGGKEAILKAARFHMEHGTTSIVPTTVCSPYEELFDFLDAFRNAKFSNIDGPNLLGIHLEGPFLSMKEKGGMDPRYVYPIDPNRYLEIIDRSEDIIRWTIAPELPGAIELGDELVRRGILPSIGHSDAIYQEILPAFEHGYIHLTHLYSACSMLRRINAFRYLGVIESAYLINEMSVEIIADGVHLPEELLKLICKCKPWDKITLITDALRWAGWEMDGSAEPLLNRNNGFEVIIEDGVAKLADRSVFAGSICTTDRCVRTMTTLAEVPLLNAVQMMTYNPAKVLSISDKKGSLEVGKDADVCIFDKDIAIKMVIVGGILKYST